MAEYVEQFGEDPLHWELSTKIRFQREILNDESSGLLSIAARLGDDWSVTEYYSRGVKDEDVLTSIEETRPWLPYLRRETLKSESKTKVLSDAIRSMILADRDGLEIGRNLLVRVACRKIPFSDDDWTTAFGQIEYLDLSFREYQVADELHTLVYEQELAR